MRGTVKTRDLVVLWARAAGMCSHPDCKIRLVLEAVGRDAQQAVGEAAHIVAHSPAGPRGDPSRLPHQINRYDNLILLCGHHHNQIDKQPSAHPVDLLRAWKAEHESWVRASTDAAPNALPWTAIVQEEQQRMDVAQALSALGPGHQASNILELRTAPAPAGYSPAALHERTAIETLLARTPLELRRFAVFSLGRIPLAIQLGCLLGDRGRVALYHYDRDRATWSWPPPDPLAASDLSLRAKRFLHGRDAALRVSLSASVSLEHIQPHVQPALDLEIRVPHPTVRWLRRQHQLTALTQLYAQALQKIRDLPCIECIHVFYAGPAAGAIALGRACNPRMNPPLQLYEYERPRYHPVLRI